MTVTALVMVTTDDLQIPNAPTIRTSLRAGGEALYFNSWRLVPANIVWGALLMLTLGTLFISPILALTSLLVVLPLPTAGVFQLAAKITRAQPVSMRDALAWRSGAKRALAAGVVIGAVTIVLGFNLVVGLATFDIVGWAYATAAFWGLLVVWFVGLALWPLLFDPLRANAPVTELVRLAGAVVVVRLPRYAGLMLVLGIVLVLSTVLAAALLTISFAFIAQVITNYSLLTADRIEGRRTIVVTD